MPNGGPDNCSTCGFNRRNAGLWRNSAPDETQGSQIAPVLRNLGLETQGSRIAPVLRNLGLESQLPFCEIRGVPVPYDHWTYCQNWHTRTRTPLGPIYASGIYDECYRRIPWHGGIPPEFVTTGVCSECGTPIHDGISIPSVEGAPLAFCCNLHYLDWWKRQHPSEDAPMSHGIGEH